MKLQLGVTEMLDWQEIWCFRCRHDHGYSHTGDEVPEAGCHLLTRILLGDDVPEIRPRDPDWQRQIPAPVSCEKFELCGGCPADEAGLERRRGLTHRQFMDRHREAVLALKPQDPEPSQ